MEFEDFVEKNAEMIIALGDTFEWEFCSAIDAHKLANDFKDNELWENQWRIVAYDVRGEPLFLDSDEKIYIYSSDVDGNNVIYEVFDNLEQLDVFAAEVKEIQMIYKKYNRTNPQLVKDKLERLKSGRKEYIQKLIDSEIEEF